MKAETQVQTQTVGYRPRPGRLILAVLLALAVTLAPVTPPASAAPAERALVCKMQPTRLGRKCFCRGAYGWRPAPMIMCQLSR